MSVAPSSWQRAVQGPRRVWNKATFETKEWKNTHERVVLMVRVMRSWSRIRFEKEAPVWGFLGSLGIPVSANPSQTTATGKRGSKRIDLRHLPTCARSRPVPKLEAKYCVRFPMSLPFQHPFLLRLRTWGHVSVIFVKKTANCLPDDTHTEIFGGLECKPIVARTVAPNLFRRTYSVAWPHGRRTSQG